MTDPPNPTPVAEMSRQDFARAKADFLRELSRDASAAREQRFIDSLPAKYSKKD